MKNKYKLPETKELNNRMKRLIWLHQERDAMRQFRTLSFGLKASVEAYYNHEIEALLRDPYICDKWNGLQEGRIV